MRTSHTLLLKYFHDPRYDFRNVEVCYIDRGAPGDISCVKGERIRNLDSNYFEIESPFGTTPIPYHRICLIRYGDEMVWKRQ